MEFVWNEIQAEDIRQQSAAAMQGQVQDMQTQAADFTQEAAYLQEEADALQAAADELRNAPPIMKTITVTSTRRDSDGNSYEYSETRTVTDHVAMAARQRQIDDMMQQIERLKDRIADLHTAAEILNTAAGILSDSIYSTNALFEEMFRMAQYTDGRYAARIQFIKSKIEAFVDKMDGLRNSFDIFTGITDWGILQQFAAANKSSSFAYMNSLKNGMGSLGQSTPSARLALMARAMDVGLFSFESNSPATNVPWEDVSYLLGQSFDDLTIEDFSSLAVVLSRLDYRSDLERFLNLLVDEAHLVGLPPPRGIIIPRNNNFTRAYTVCVKKVTGIQVFLDVQAALLLERQTNLRSMGVMYEHINDNRRRLIQNSALLTSITMMAPPSSLAVPEGARQHQLIVVNDNEKPFTLTSWGVDEGWLTVSARTTSYWELMPYFRFEIHNAETHLSQALNGPEVSQKLRNVLGEEFSTRHLHDPSGDIIHAAAGLGMNLATLGMANVATASLDVVMATVNAGASWNEGVAQAAAIQQDFSTILGNWELRELHQALGLDAVLIWSPGEDPHLVSRGAPDSLERLAKLNGYVEDDLIVSRDDFRINPVDATIEAFRSLTIAQEGAMLRYNPQKPEREIGSNNPVELPSIVEDVFQ